MSEEKEIKSREKLEVLSETLIAVGVLLLIIAALDYIIELSQNPLYVILSFVVNALIKIVGESAAVPLLLAIILFIAAGIVKVGTFFKDEEDLEVYRSLIYKSWIGDLIGLFLASICYAMRLISAAFVVGMGFVLFIAPLIVSGILKGLEYLIKIFSR